MSCLHLNTGYRALLLLSSLEELVLPAGVVTALLPDVQHKRGTSCFTLRGKVHSLLPTPGHLYQGRDTHKLTGTQEQDCHEEAPGVVSPACGGEGYSA